MEQTYKLDQFEIAHEKDLQKIIDEQFIKQAIDRFATMADSLQAALKRVEA